MLEMLGQVARGPEAERGDLPWLDRMIERLHGEFDRQLTLDDLGREAGVHPVRLSRAFRRRMKMGIGEYVRALRVRFAEERLRDRDLPLALIAAEAGFVDQSHMTRAFRRVTGRTPGALRRAGR